jgi:beta-glucosidase
LFAFGHGLSYTTFKFNNLQVTVKNNVILAKCDITNTGKMSGSEVAQLYIHQNLSSVDRPEKELKAFQKVYLNPGEKKTITMQLTKEDLAFYSEQKKAWVLEPGKFKFLVGCASDDIKLQKEIEL